MTVLAFGGACTVPMTFCDHIASNFYRLLLTAYLRRLRRLRYMASPSCNPTASAPSILVILDDPNSTSLALVRPSASAYTTHHTTVVGPTVPFCLSPSLVTRPSSFALRPSSPHEQASGGRVWDPSLGPESGQTGKARGNKTPSISANPPLAVAQSRKRNSSMQSTGVKCGSPPRMRIVRPDWATASYMPPMGHISISLTGSTPNETPVCAGCVVDTTLSPSSNLDAGACHHPLRKMRSKLRISAGSCRVALGLTTSWQWSG